MAHTCPFDNDHEPLKLEEGALQALEGGYCPLCLHDFAVEASCVECGHRFELDTSTDPALVKVIPLED